MNLVVHPGIFDCLVPTFDYYDRLRYWIDRGLHYSFLTAFGLRSTNEKLIIFAMKISYTTQK